jgi:diguanylate cyclase (GGDEF)-like protein/PAS domain S-box-containing protein
MTDPLASLTKAQLIKEVQKLHAQILLHDELSDPREKLIEWGRVSQEAVEACADLSAQGIVLVDPQDMLTYANPAACKMLGVPADALIQMSILSFLDQENGTIYRTMSEKRAHSESDIYSLSILRPDGLSRRLIATTIPYYQARKWSGSFIIFCDAAEENPGEKMKEETRQRTENIIDLLPDATYAVDMQGKVIAWNHAMEELSAVSSREMIGKGNHEYALPFYGVRQPLLIDLLLKDDPDYEKNYFHLERINNHLVGETWVNLPDGTRHCLWAVASLLLDGEKHPIGAIECIRDITKRVELEGELRESEGRYRSLFETNTAVMMIVDPDTGNIIDVNRAACKYYGYTQAQLLSLNIADINTLPMDEIKNRMKKVVQEVDDRYSFMHRLSNGEIRNVEVNSTPILLHNKKYLFSIISDVTEKLKFEEALRESEERFYSLFKASPIGIGVFKTDGMLSDANQSFLEIFGLESSKQIIHTNLFTHYNLPETCMDDLSKTRHIQLERSIDLQEFFKKYAVVSIIKGIIHINLSVTQLRGKNSGKLIGYLMLVQDVTEQRLTEERIKYMSMHDALTGLFNRGFFTAEMERLEKGRNYPITIIMADVDGLKTLNDTKGHIAGDQLLIYSAQILHSAFRKEDIIARLGGDEFGIILPECTSRAGERSVQRIRQCIDQHNLMHLEFPVSISVGKATAVTPCDLNKVMDEADREMYREKSIKKTTRI